MPRGASDSPPRYVADRRQRLRVDQLERRRDDARAHDPEDRVDRRGDGGKGGAERRLHRRLRDEPQHDPRDDRERPFRANEQVREVVAGNVLHRLAAGLDDLAGRQHRLEPEDVVAGHPVLERARPAGVFADVAADRRPAEAGWVRRIEQPDALDGVLQVARDDVRLDDGDEVRLVDLEDPVQPLQAEHDAAPHGHGPAGVPGAGAARHERRPRLVAVAGDGGDLGRRPGQDDDVGEAAAIHPVNAVALAARVVGPDELVADDR